MPGCPSCGVAVVPGYVRCPKCHGVLPYGSGRVKRSSVEPGGTSVDEPGRFPIGAIVAAIVVAAAIVLFFGLRKGATNDDAPPPSTPDIAEPPPAAQTGEAPPPPTQPESLADESPRGPNPQAIAAALVYTLRRDRMFAKITIVTDRVDVQTSSCDDPQLGPALQGSAAAFRSAGLTKLRCLEQSGRVVFERDL
jgi:hypothetical protein